MNRREALVELLAGLPAATTITRAEVHPEDVVVLTVPGPITDAIEERIRGAMAAAFPGLRVVVLGDGITWSILRHEAR